MRLLLVKSVSLLKRGDFLLQMSKKTAPLRNVSPSLTSVRGRYPQTSREAQSLSCEGGLTRLLPSDVWPYSRRNHCGDFLLARTHGHSRWLNLAFVTGTIVMTSCLGALLDIPDG